MQEGGQRRGGMKGHKEEGENKATPWRDPKVATIHCVSLSPAQSGSATFLKHLNWKAMTYEHTLGFVNWRALNFDGRVLEQSLLWGAVGCCELLQQCPINTSSRVALGM